MTVQERIRNIRIMEMMKEVGEKTEDGKLIYRAPDGTVLLQAEMKVNNKA